MAQTTLSATQKYSSASAPMTQQLSPARHPRGQSWTGRIRATGLVAVVGLVTAAPIHASPDEVDIAVDAIVMVGSIGGIPVGQTEATVIKGIVRCAINNRPVLNCARYEVVQRLPTEARPLALCVLEGKPIDQCGAGEALRHLPAPARTVVTCIAERVDIGKCGEGVALDPAQRQALDVIDKLKADGRSALGQADTGTIRNIIGIAEGIRSDDWLKVAQHGGTEIYKAAAKILLRIFLPALMPAGALIDPIIDVMIQSRVDLATQVIRGVKAGDARIIGQAVAEAYLLQSVRVPCSIPGIPEDLKEAVCGRLGNIIHSLAGVGGDAADLALRLIKDPLGIPDTLWNELEGLRGTLAGKESDCVPPEEYYARNYATSYRMGVAERQVNQSRLDALVGTLNWHCRKYYDRCFFSQHFDRLCEPQRTMFNDHVNQLVAALNRAALLYSRSFDDYAASRGPQRACLAETFTRATNEFLDRCAASLAVQIPLSGDPARQVHRTACARAMARVDTAAVLRSSCPKPQAPTGCRVEGGGGRCGYVTVNCDAPLPPATAYALGGVNNLKIFRSVPERGAIIAEYVGAEGAYSMKACAGNSLGVVTCSAPFTVTLGSATAKDCYSKPPPDGTRSCPSGTTRCPGRGPACVPIAQCYPVR